MWKKFIPCRSKALYSLQKFPSWKFSQNFCDQASLPKYNYGLPGKGKSKKQPSKSIITKLLGEIVFGIHPVMLALKIEKRTFHKLYIQKLAGHSDHHQQILSLCNKKGIIVMPSNKQLLDRLSGNRPHQGVCLDASIFKVDTLEIDCFREAKMKARKEFPLWLMLYRIQDPMNFGAILRSCYFLNVDKVIFAQEKSAPLNPVVSKSSSGAMEIIRMSATRTEQNLIYMIKTEKKNGWNVIGSIGPEHASLFGHSSVIPVENFSVTGPTILIIGNEGTGLTDQMLKHCDKLLTINQRRDDPCPLIDSLNVSVATGILLHSLKKGRNTS